MTIRENVCFGLTELPKKKALLQADAALERVGLLHYAERYPHVLSGGEQQRVALARALAPRPAVLLMDEPFSGLDSRLKDSIRADTLAILRETRATAIVVTHDAEEAMRMADRIALLKDGRLVQVGTADELYRRPCDLFTAGFFSEINVFDARVRDGHVETPLGVVATGQYTEGQPLSVAVRLSGIRLDETVEKFRRASCPGASWASWSFWNSPCRSPNARSAPASAPICCRKDCVTSRFPLTSATYWCLKKTHQHLRVRQEEASPEGCA